MTALCIFSIKIALIQYLHDRVLTSEMTQLGSEIHLETLQLPLLYQLPESF